MADNPFELIDEGAQPLPEPTPEPEPGSAGPTVQPSGVPAGEPSPEPKPRDERMVPLAALHEERAKRKQLEASQHEQSQRFDKLQERLDKLQSLRDAPPEVSYEENPGEYLRRNQEAQAKELAELRQQREQQDQMTEQQRKAVQFESHVQAREQEFAQANKDYAEAAEFLRKSRVEEYMAAGLSFEQAQAETNLDRAKFAYNALLRDRNPGEVFYELAKTRGYKAANGEKEQPKVDLEQIQKKMETTTSLGPSGGAATGELTLDQLAGMTDEEFEKATEGKNWQRLWQ